MKLYLQENPIEKHGIAKIANWVGRGDSCVAMKTKSLKSKLNAAFSLVELLVVIAVIAVIAGIAIPNIIGTREAAVAAQEHYDEASLTHMQKQVVALRGGTEPTEAELQAGIAITNGTNVITFKLD